MIDRTEGGMNTKLHSVTDTNGCPLSFFITSGQVSDYIGAASLLNELPEARWLLSPRPGGSVSARVGVALIPDPPEMRIFRTKRVIRRGLAPGR